LGTFIATEKTRWAQVIKESGIKFDWQINWGQLIGVRSTLIWSIKGDKG
jgi:hypothetical protein